MAASHDRSFRILQSTRIALAIATLATTGIATLGCDDSSGGGGDDDGGGGSSSSESPTGGETCDLRAENWYSECDAGCGDVMVCQSFCSDCDNKCMVPCVDSSDCEAVGAGSCEESTYGSNRCSAAPSKCPGSGDDDVEEDDTSSSGSGGSCSETTTSCSINGDCCDFDSGGALCVDYGSGGLCGATCSSGSECVSGCCAATQEGSYVCAPSNFCDG